MRFVMKCKLCVHQHFSGEKVKEFCLIFKGIPWEKKSLEAIGKTHGCLHRTKLISKTSVLLFTSNDICLLKMSNFPLRSLVKISNISSKFPYNVSM